MNRKILHNLLRLSTASFLLLFMGNIQAQSVEIFSNPSSSQNIVTGNSNYHVGEVIYLDGEIGATNFLTAAAAINHIEISVNTPGAPTSFGNFAIYLKEVPAATTTFAAGVYNKTGYTQVYSGTIDLTAVGWFSIELTTPFTRIAPLLAQQEQPLCDVANQGIAPALIATMMELRVSS